MQLIDAGRWSPVPRSRLFFSSLPKCFRTLPDFRTGVWEAGWHRRLGSPEMPTMMRNRGRGNIRASTYHYRLEHMIYHEDTPFLTADPAQLPGLIARTLPDSLRGLFTLLIDNRKLTDDQEKAVIPLVEWLQ